MKQHIYKTSLRGLVSHHAPKDSQKKGKRIKIKWEQCYKISEQPAYV